MPSNTFATLKRMINARLRPADEGQDLLEYRTPHGADRDFRNRGCVDPWQYGQHRLLAVHCRKFLAPPSPSLAAGAARGHGRSTCARGAFRTR